jgi:MFS family permease
MGSTAMGWLVYQLTNSTFLLGAVTAAGTAPMVLFSIWGGSLADRHPKRDILVATQIASMVLALLLAVLVWFGHIQPWEIVLVSLLNGVAMGFDMPARQSFVIEMTSREDLLNAISLNSSVFNAARLVGPALAGLMLAHGGAAACFLINGLSYLAVIVSLLRMRLPPHVPAARAASPVAHALGGLRYVWGHARLFTIMSLFAVVGIFGWSYSVLLPAYAKDVLGLGADAYGALLSAAGVGAMAGALTVASAGDRFPPRLLVLGGLWFFSAMLLLLAVSGSLRLSLAAQALTSFGMMIFFSTTNSTLQQIVPDGMRGRVMGVWSLVFGTIIPLGSLQAGALARWIGIRWTIALGALLCAAAAAVTLAIVRRRDAAGAG